VSFRPGERASNAFQVDYEFTANAQLWPRALNTDIGGVNGTIYLIVGDVRSPQVFFSAEMANGCIPGQLGTNSGEGFDFVNGFAFLSVHLHFLNDAVMI